MTQFFLSDSELRNTNDWIKKKDQSLTKGTEEYRFGPSSV